MDLIPISILVLLILTAIVMYTKNVFGTQVRDVVEQIKSTTGIQPHPLGEAVVSDIFCVPFDKPLFITYILRFSGASTLFRFTNSLLIPINIIIDDDPQLKFQLIGQPQIAGEYFFLPVRIYDNDISDDENPWVGDRFIAMSTDKMLNSDTWKMKTICMFEDAIPVDAPPFNKPAVACVIDESLDLKADYLIFFPSTSQFMFIKTPLHLRASENNNEKDISCWYWHERNALIVHRMRCQEPVIIDVTNSKPYILGWHCIPADKHPPPPPPKDKDNEHMILPTGSTGCTFGPARTRSQKLSTDKLLYYGYDLFVIVDMVSKTITDNVRLPANVNPAERRYFDTAGYDTVTQKLCTYSPWRREWLQLPIFLARGMFGREINWIKGPSPWSHVFTDPRSMRLCTISYPLSDRRQYISEVQGTLETEEI